VFRARWNQNIVAMKFFDLTPKSLVGQPDKYDPPVPCAPHIRPPRRAHKIVDLTSHQNEPAAGSSAGSSVKRCEELDADQHADLTADDAGKWAPRVCEWARRVCE
jgi:hypothetical protein